MTLPRFAALTEYWRTFPPAHVVLRIAFGKNVPTLPSDSPDYNRADIAGADIIGASPIVQVPHG